MEFDPVYSLLCLVLLVLHIMSTSESLYLKAEFGTAVLVEFFRLLMIIDAMFVCYNIDVCVTSIGCYCFTCKCMEEPKIKILRPYALLPLINSQYIHWQISAHKITH